MKKPGLLRTYKEMRNMPIKKDKAAKHQLRINIARTIIRVKRELLQIPMDGSRKLIDSSFHDYDIMDALSINILWKYDTVEAPDGTKAFAVFVPDTLDIWVAANIPEPEYNVPHNIAHEYAHFIQYAEERPYDEQEADAFAERILRELMIERKV